MLSLEARAIAAGHAWKRHAVEQNEFPEITTKDQFAELVEHIMTDATSQTKDLSRGRKAWWNPEKGVVVITNPKSIDVGTAFRPRNGKEYFENLR